MNKRTPGKWIRDYGCSLGHVKAVILDGKRETPTVCKYGRGICADSITEEEMQANGHLLAAAPDLLEAAKIVLAGLNARIDAADGHHVPVFDGIADLHTAIAKAEGKLVCSHCGDSLTGHEDESGTHCRWCVISQAAEESPVVQTVEN